MAGLLDKLPIKSDFLGTLDLKTGSLIIAAICVAHPFAYGCTLFMPLSYLIFTIWILLAAFFATSILLFQGLIANNTLYIEIWIWYTLVFVVIMVLLMILLAIVLVSRKHRKKVILLILGILWYVVTVYFVLVVNSHRKTLIPDSGDSDATTTSPQDNEESTTTPAPPPPPPSPPEEPTEPTEPTEPAEESRRMGRHPKPDHTGSKVIHEGLSSTVRGITRYPPTNFHSGWFKLPNRTRVNVHLKTQITY